MKRLLVCLQRLLKDHSHARCRPRKITPNETSGTRAQPAAATSLIHWTRLECHKELLQIGSAKSYSIIHWVSGKKDSFFLGEAASSGAPVCHVRMRLMGLQTLIVPKKNVDVKLVFSSRHRESL